MLNYLMCQLKYYIKYEFIEVYYYLCGRFFKKEITVIINDISGFNYRLSPRMRIHIFIEEHRRINGCINLR